MWLKMNRLFLVAAMAAVLVIGLFAGRPALAATYIAFDLTPSSFIQSRGDFANGTQYVGSGTTDNKYWQPILWNDNSGNYSILGNDKGTIIGPMRNCGSQQVGFGSLWNGTADSRVYLTTPNSFFSAVTGTNGTQQVGYLGPNYRATLWNGGPDKYIDLHPNGYWDSQALGISGTQAFGYASSQYPHAMIWNVNANTSIDLNPNEYDCSEILGSNGIQQVGTSWNVNDLQSHAILWSGSKDNIIDLTPAGFTTCFANGINGTQQVGDGHGPATNNNEHALLWNGTVDGYIDLHQFLPIDFSQSVANTIDAEGNIIGTAYYASGQSRAILWVPVPEPSTLVLLGIGMIGLIGYTWRKRQ
ncbi:MAG: PEP-CTERM sorting domain-containing protein [Thermoguttaceae bacterium]|jgi:hypothetical protein